MKRLLIILILISFISGCGSTDKAPELTGDVVAPVVPVAETPQEDVKTYEFSVLNKEVFIEEICTVTSSIKNLDSVKHRYRINTYVIVNGVKQEVGEEFYLEPRKIRTIVRDIKCPKGSEGSLGAEGLQLNR